MEFSWELSQFLEQISGRRDLIWEFWVGRYLPHLFRANLATQTRYSGRRRRFYHHQWRHWSMTAYCYQVNGTGAAIDCRRHLWTRCTLCHQRFWTTLEKSKKLSIPAGIRKLFSCGIAEPKIIELHWRIRGIDNWTENKSFSSFW